MRKCTALLLSLLLLLSGCGAAPQQLEQESTPQQNTEEAAPQPNTQLSQNTEGFIPQEEQTDIPAQNTENSDAEQNTGSAEPLKPENTPSQTDDGVHTVSQAQHPLTLDSASEDVDTDALTQLLKTGSGSVPLTKDSWILFYLGGVSEVTGAALKFSGAAPAEVTVRSTDYTLGKNYGQAVFRGADGAAQLELSAAFLLLTVSEGCTLSGISLTYTPAYPACLDEDEEEFLSATDPANPLHVYRRNIPMAVVNLAEELTAGLPENAAPHEKILAFMDYIATFHVGLNRNIPTIQTFRDAIGSCGDYSNILSALCATQGWETHIITLANYPETAGHVVAEIKVNDRWCVYDPTYGAYYTTTPEDMKTPYVLSYEELQSGRGNDADVTCIVRTEERLTSQTAYDFLGPDIYVKANPAGVIGPENPLFYPLIMDAAGDTLITSDEYTTAYQGISYLGAANMNNSHIWTLKNLTPGKEYRFVLTGRWIGGDITPQDVVETSAALSGGALRSGASHTFSNDDPASMVWEIVFVPQRAEVTLTLTHPYRGPDFRYVSLSSFELRQS